MRKTAFLPTLALAAALIFALVLSACGQAAPAAQPTTAPAAKPAATTAPAAKPAATTAPSAPAATKAPSAPAATKAPAASGAPALTKEYKLSMATGGTAGTYYPFGGAMASLWSNNIKGVTVTVEATGGSVENVRLLESGVLNWR